MSTSNKTQPPRGGAPSGADGGAGAGGQAGAPNSYTRFIPREELRGFSAWAPESFEDPSVSKSAPGQSPAGGGVHKAPFAVRAGVAGAQGQGAARTEPPGPVGGVPGQAPAPAKAPEPEPAPVDMDAVVRDSRQAGYQDGYRDGLSALESYKQTQAAQMAAFMSDQVGALVNDLHARLESLEQQLSGRIAGVALELARQVVRSEITQRPELVLSVADDAMTTLLASARQVVLRLNPEDHALAHGALEEVLQARGARMVADPHVSQGGCIVESDIAVVDATVEARWRKVAAAMGVATEWDGSFTPGADADAQSQWLDDMDPLSSTGN
jgi:flagellar biosynthesis/type III secretory pathway protein FliH